MVQACPSLIKPSFLVDSKWGLAFSKDVFVNYTDSSVLEQLEDYYTRATKYIQVAKENESEFAAFVQELALFLSSKNIRFSTKSRWYKNLIKDTSKFYNLPDIVYDHLDVLSIYGYYYKTGEFCYVQDYEHHHRFNSFELAKEFYYKCKEDYAKKEREEQIKLEKYVEAINSARKIGFDTTSMSVEDIIYFYENGWFLGEEGEEEEES